MLAEISSLMRDREQYEGRLSEKNQQLCTAQEEISNLKTLLGDLEGKVQTLMRENHDLIRQLHGMN